MRNEGGFMELRHLRYFLAVAQHGHFGRAAESLGIRQPPLSQQIQALEGELGVQLFVRSHRGSELTPAGEAFAEHARHCLAAAESARSEAQRVARGDSGHLVIGFLPSAFDTVLPKVLATFTRRWPRVALEPVEFTLTSQAISELRRGSVDWVIGRPLIATASSEDDLLALRLTDDRISVVLPKSHPLASRSRISPASLRGERFILTPLEERFPRYWQMVCATAGFEPQVAARVQGVHTVVGMVAAGVGLGLVPQSAGTSARADVTFVPLSPPVLAPPLTLVWRKGDDRELSRRFLTVVRTVLHLTFDPVSGQQLDRDFLAALRQQLNRMK
jgi:DNA-binding transcriptional LysR family regulator